MGYDPINTGPADQLRRQMEEDAQAAREAAMANGTEVFQSVIKLRAAVSEVERVVLQQEASLNELDARKTFTRTHEEWETKTVPKNTITEAERHFIFERPDRKRNAILTFSTEMTASYANTYVTARVIDSSNNQILVQPFPSTLEELDVMVISGSAPVVVEPDVTPEFQFIYRWDPTFVGEAVVGWYGFTRVNLSFLDPNDD